VRRSARMVGTGISQGADRLRRAITGSETPGDAPGAAHGDAPGGEAD
jgi:hypothetical protein